MLEQGCVGQFGNGGWYFTKDTPVFLLPLSHHWDMYFVCKYLIAFSSVTKMGEIQGKNLIQMGLEQGCMDSLGMEACFSLSLPYHRDVLHQQRKEKKERKKFL